MRGAEYPHINRHFLLPADAAHGLFLNGSQQLDLHGQRQVGDLIEKQSACVRHLEQSGLVLEGAAETAFAMAEELAFHQLRGNGPAIDGYKRLAGA
ncbi:hypothetical protein D3C78_786880 [compost metagenome]